ncbi:hypothetical protein C6503_13745 [Candidatus Poribacteria bacterium]|nr:MAG: hypothetical protein C6503_13745 [Candidatus Poribacteria bacterium]
MSRWALPEGAIARLGQGIFSGITFSMDESTVATWSRLGVWLYDAATLTLFDLLATERGWITHVAFSPNDALIAVGNQDGDIKVWDRHTQRYVSKMERVRNSPLNCNSVNRLVFSPDGHLLASSGGRYDSVYVWHHESGEQVAEFTVDESLKPRFPPGFIPLSFSPDGTLLAAATPEHTISIWDLEAKKRIAYLKGHVDLVAELIFSPCGQFLTSADRNGILHEWDVHKIAEMASAVGFSELPTYATGPTKLAYFTDGTFIAAGNHESTVTLWDPKRGNKLRTLRSERCPFPVCFSPQTLQLVLSGKRDLSDEIQLWDIGETSPQRSLSIREYTSPCGAVTFSPDGKILAAGHWNGRICLWDIQRLKRLKTFGTGNTSAVNSLDFSPCGKQLASGASDSTIKIWDIEKVEVPLAAFTADQKEDQVWGACVAFLPSGGLVCAYSKGHLSVWDGEKKRTAFPIGTARRPKISVSPDGKQVAVAHFSENQAELYDVETGQLLVELCLAKEREPAKYSGDALRVQAYLRLVKKTVERNPAQVVGPIIFSPCRTVIAGGLLGEIRLWDATTYEVLKVFCPPHGCQRVGALTFSPCGRYLVSGASWMNTDQMSIRLWEVATGENIATFWGHSTDVQDLAFSPDGTLLVSGSYDGTLLLWDMKPYL